MYELFVVRFLQTKVMSKKKFRQDSSIYFRRGNNMQGHRSSIAFEVIGTVSNQFNFFLRKKFERKKSTKTQNNQFFPSQKFLCAKNSCLCCFLFAFFCFVSLFWFGLRFWLEIFKYNTIRLTYTPINPPIENYLSLILAQSFCHTYLFLSVRAYFYLSGTIFICQYLFSSVRISSYL